MEVCGRVAVVVFLLVKGLAGEILCKGPDPRAAVVNIANKLMPVSEGPQPRT